MGGYTQPPNHEATETWHDGHHRYQRKRTPLYYAAENGYSKVIKVLFNHNKDIEITPDILSKAAYASLKQQENVLELLLHRDGKIQISQAVLQS